MPVKGKIGALLLCNLLVACGAAKPNLFNGQYYMAGDSNCVNGRQVAPNKIMCIDKDGNDTGWRQALSKADLEGYHRQRKADIKNAKQALAGVANTLTQYGSSMRQNASTIPNVQFPGPSTRTGSPVWSTNNAATTPTNSSDMNKWVPSSGVVPKAPITVIYGNCLGTISNGQCIGVFEQTSGGNFICHGPFVSGSCRGQLTLSKP